ncbi:MAG: hypothetical protein RMJ07_06100 [Nitrososphaerota archaeon]|nr:hypothetical protein [Candidatus Bathyarchaeota archaeon]MDW8049231.1 hypothetical protein [Nitrososphaerota archaeon]
MRPEDAVKISRDLRMISQTFKEAADVMVGSLDAVRSVRPLVAGSRANSIGSKMIKVGFGCVMFPEPFISDLIGSALIVAGMLIKKTGGRNIAEVLREAQRSMSVLRKICEDKGLL